MTYSKQLNEDIWTNVIDKHATEDLKNLLRWQLQAREPITKFSDVRKGDHLIKRKSVGGRVLYYHHFLCTGSNDEGQPTIIHYFNTATNAIKRLLPSGSYGSGSALGQLGIVQEIAIPNNDFIGSESELQTKGGEVERVVWPEELKRYTADEVVERARKRMNEKNYDLAENNCESFVMWCLCNWNISLQATALVLTVKEIASGIIRLFFKAFEQVPKAITEIVEKVVGRTAFGNVIDKVGIQGISALGCTIGIILTLVVEIGYASYCVYHAKEDWDNGISIKTREEFITKVIDSLFLSSSRAIGCIAGMFLGEIFIPIPFVGGFIGLFIGTIMGHFAGKGLSKLLSDQLASTLQIFIQLTF